MAKAYEPAGFCATCGYPIDGGTCPECGGYSDVPSRIDPRVSRSRPWAIAFLVSGIASVLLMIAIRVAETVGWSDNYYHLPQFLCTIIGCVSAIQYLRTRSKRESRLLAGLAWLAFSLTTLWLGFMLFVIVYGVVVMSAFD
jgi:hypothetical protein